MMQTNQFWKMLSMAGLSAGLMLWAAQSTPVLAQETKEDEEVGENHESGEHNEQALPPLNERQTAKAKAIAEYFKVEESLVASMRQDKKMGWGGITHLFVIAQKSGQTPETILALRDQNMGWGQIAAKYGLKLGEIRRDVRLARRTTAANERAAREKWAERREHKEDKPGREERHRRGRDERSWSRVERAGRAERDDPVRGFRAQEKSRVSFRVRD